MPTKAKTRWRAYCKHADCAWKEVQWSGGGRTPLDLTQQMILHTDTENHPCGSESRTRYETTVVTAMGDVTVDVWADGTVTELLDHVLRNLQIDTSNREQYQLVLGSEPLTEEDSLGKLGYHSDKTLYLESNPVEI